MSSNVKIKASMIGLALAGGVAFSTVATAGGSVIDQNIAAIFAPDSRPTASAAGQRVEGVSILDGIARSWSDPSRSASRDASNGSAAAGASTASAPASGSTTVQESLRGVFSAYSAD